MNSALYFAISLAVLAVGYFLYRTFFRTFFKFRGTRVVTCPETGRPVAVEVDALNAAERAALGDTHVQLKSCTRWPERQDCGQECLAELEAAPEECLLKAILGRWYAGKACVFCGREFGVIHWHDHKPCLRAPSGETIEWSQFKPETVGEVLKTHDPVCWDCHIAETFRRSYPDMVVDRDWKTPERKASRTAGDRL